MVMAGGSVEGESVFNGCRVSGWEDEEDAETDGIVQLSHPYMTTGKTIALSRWTFVGKVMSLLFNMLSRLVIFSSGEK